MTLLFGDESVRPIAVVKPVSSSFFSLLVHFAVIAVLLAINFSAGVLKLPQNLHATMLVAPAPPLAPPRAGVAATRVVRRTPSKFVLPATVAIPKLPATQELAIADAPPELEAGAVPGGVPDGPGEWRDPGSQAPGDDQSRLSEACIECAHSGRGPRGGHHR